MKIPRIWQRADQEAAGPKGKTVLTGWGWSETQADEAAARAKQALARQIEHWRAGTLEHGSAYGYPDRLPREVILREIPTPDGTGIAAFLSRNAMGCEILNVDCLWIADIDLPDPPQAGGFLAFLKGLFARPQAVPQAGDDLSSPLVAEQLARLESWVAAYPGWGGRVYRTKAGLRYICTSAPRSMSADGGLARRMLEELGSDPLYIRLCQIQDCFRARLTPKPWRCQLPDFRVQWPWPDERDETRFNRWLAKYEETAADYATCRYLLAVGEPVVHPELLPLLELHDEETRAFTDLPLA